MVSTGTAMAPPVASIGIAMAAGAVASGGAINSLSHCLAVLRLHPHRRAAPDMVDANSGFCWNWTNASALVSRRRARTLMERQAAAGRVRWVVLLGNIVHSIWLMAHENP
jgi:hypothetical protein